MAKKANLSGVEPKGTDRIQFDFRIKGVRYRPTIYRTPSEANLRRAYQQLREIKARIKSGTFNFDEEFPDYRYKPEAPKQQEEATKTCNDVFKAFLAHCEMRVGMNDLAYSTLEGYREILDVVFGPKIGGEPFEQVVYSQLVEIVSAHTKGKKKKTYNNVTSAVRTAFKFGYKDLPGKFNPALGLSTFRITKKDRPPVDPFTVPDVEAIISASHRIHGEWYGNYEEFRFFTGLRQSEQFALEVGDCDLANAAISITKAVVLSRAKNRTKTNQDREITLCPRALEVLRSQLVLRAQMVSAGKISHRCVFFTEGGEPFQTVYLPYNRWREVLETLPIRYRKPYNARHTYISWRLMKGDNPLLVAQEDGHSVETMLRTYAAWIKGAKSEDVERIKQAMTARPSIDAVGDESGVRGPLQSPDLATIWPPTEQIDGLRGATGDTTHGPTQAPSVCFNRSKGGKTDTEELAGVAGFEPTNGGIKTRHNSQHNQQVSDSTDRNIPLQSLRFPIAATKPATTPSALRRCRFPGTGIKAGTRDLIAMRVHTDIRSSNEHEESGTRQTMVVRIPARTRLAPTPGVRHATLGAIGRKALQPDASHRTHIDSGAHCERATGSPTNQGAGIPRSLFPPWGPFLCQILPKALRFRDEHNEYLPA